MKDGYNNNLQGGDSDGYIDENGNYIGEGYYDENGNYAEAGYYDSKGNYIGGGYYDADGNHVSGSYYDEKGNYVQGGFYDGTNCYDDSSEDFIYTDDIENFDTNRGRSSHSSGKAAAKKSSGKAKKKNKIGVIIARAVLVLVTFLLITVGGLYMTMFYICKGPSEAAKDLFVSTILETGQMKFLASLYFTKEEILEITSQNSMGTLDAEVDTGLITVGGASDSEDGAEGENSFDINGFELVEITGRTYFAKMMIINDPSRVHLTTLYNGGWPEYGQNLDVLVNSGDYLAGVNGGEYVSESNKGGQPKGIVVCDGEIQYNSPQAGDVMVGFNYDNILIIRDIGGLSAAAARDLVAELNIRDAVSFKDIDDGDDNHFSKLIINGESIELNGSGSGANPRTVIGQTADGTVLLLVTDGRGASGHLGATAADIISIMKEYGAVNAANLDGGSSSCMYYDGDYEMTSVTLYYSNASWRLPLAFVVERRD